MYKDVLFPYKNWDNNINIFQYLSFVSAASCDNLSKLSNIIKVKVSSIMDHYLFIYPLTLSVLIDLVNAIIMIPKSWWLTLPKKFLLRLCHMPKREGRRFLFINYSATSLGRLIQVSIALQSGTRTW